jgi:hypothetical protein
MQEEKNPLCKTDITESVQYDPQIKPIQNPIHNEQLNNSLKNFILVRGVLRKFNIVPYLRMKQHPIKVNDC